MRTLACVLIATLSATGLALAQSGTLSVDYTALQRDGIQFGLDAWNVYHPNEQKTLVTFGREACQAVFDVYVDQRAMAQELLANIRDKYLGLTDANKTAVEDYINACITSGTCA